MAQLSHRLSMPCATSAMTGTVFSAMRAFSRHQKHIAGVRSGAKVEEHWIHPVMYAMTRMGLSPMVV